jgi:hypothetical protein
MNGDIDRGSEDRLVNYKRYSIEAVEDRPGQWKAHIRRLDGEPISPQPNGLPGPVVVTHAFPSAEAAIKEAKTAIDHGGVA